MFSVLDDKDAAGMLRELVDLVVAAGHVDLRDARHEAIEIEDEHDRTGGHGSRETRDE